jgi:hypothetical protein
MRRLADHLLETTPPREKEPAPLVFLWAAGVVALVTFLAGIVL